MVIGAVVFGAAKATHLKMKDGREFKNPEIVSFDKDWTGKFGVIEPDEPSETNILEISKVEFVY